MNNIWLLKLSRNRNSRHMVRALKCEIRLRFAISSHPSSFAKTFIYFTLFKITYANWNGADCFLLETIYLSTQLIVGVCFHMQLDLNWFQIDPSVNWHDFFLYWKYCLISPWLLYCLCSIFTKVPLCSSWRASGVES